MVINLGSTMKNKNLSKILYIENGIGYGGAIICLRHLVRNLDRKRFDPVVVTSRTGPQYEEIASEARWRHFSDRIMDLKRVQKCLEQSEYLNAHPIVRLIVNQGIARFDDLVNFLPFFLWLFIIAIQDRPSLIHVNNEPLCNRAGILVGKLLCIPVVCHVRGNLDGSRMMKWLYGLPDHFIPVSNWVSAGIGKLGVPLDKRTVIYDGIDLDKLDLKADPSGFRTQFGVPKEAFAVGLVGLLIPWKGQDIFIDSAKQLVNEIPGLVMLAIGGTPEGLETYATELKQRVVKEGLESNVIFTGHVDDMCVTYNALDVVVSASTMPEPLGTMVIETMAMGRPLIVPSHGGGLEMNIHEQTALVFEAGNYKSLSDNILRLYKDSELREKLGQNARLKALAAFDVETHARHVEQVYENVLKIA